MTQTKVFAFSLPALFFLIRKQLFDSVLLSYFDPANVYFVLGEKKIFFDQADN